MGHVNRFAIPAEDMKRACKFYSEVFGWMFIRMPDSEYYTVKTGPAGEIQDNSSMASDESFINGIMAKREGMFYNPVVIISVPSIDECAKKILELGGEMLVDKLIVDGVGQLAYFQDTEGNTVGLHEAG